MEKYETPVLEVMSFRDEDIIVTSPSTDDDEMNILSF